MNVRYEQFSASGVAKKARRTRSRCGSEQVILCVRVTIIVLDSYCGGAYHAGLFELAAERCGGHGETA